MSDKKYTFVYHINREDGLIEEKFPSSNLLTGISFISLISSLEEVLAGNPLGEVEVYKGKKLLTKKLIGKIYETYIKKKNLKRIKINKIVNYSSKLVDNKNYQSFIIKAQDAIFSSIKDAEGEPPSVIKAFDIYKFLFLNGYLDYIPSEATIIFNKKEYVGRSQVLFIFRKLYITYKIDLNIDIIDFSMVDDVIQVIYHAKSEKGCEIENVIIEVVNGKRIIIAYQ